jgi:hypothetical protein
LEWNLSGSFAVSFVVLLLFATAERLFLGCNLLLCCMESESVAVSVLDFTVGAAILCIFYAIFRFLLLCCSCWFPSALAFVFFNFSEGFVCCFRPAVVFLLPLLFNYSSCFSVLFCTFLGTPCARARTCGISIILADSK